MTASRNYPHTRRDDTTETLAGIDFPDPYQWLEDGRSMEVRAWQQEQNDLTSSYLARLTNKEAVRSLVDQVFAGRSPGVPRYAGGLWFRREPVVEGTNHPPLVVSEAPTAPGRILFDPDAVKSECPLNIEWLSPSPNGHVVAFGVSSDGSERNRLHLLDVASGEEMPDRIPQAIMDSWTGGAQWLPDGSGFYYVALDPILGPYRQAIFFHRLGEPPPEKPELIPDPSATFGYCLAQVDRAGRWVVALMPIATPRPQYVRDLASDDGWRPFVQNAQATVVGAVVGDYYVAVTDREAPRGRLVAIPLDNRSPDDPTTWRELLPESGAVLRTVRLAGDRLFVTELVDTYARVRILDLDGHVLGELPLPGRGALAEQPFPLMNALPSGHPDDYLFSFSTLTSSWGLYRYQTKTGEIEELRAPAVTLPDALVEDCWATSFDGTRIPYHLVRRRDLDSSDPQPALIYAYGSGNVATTPQYPNAMTALVRAGGIFVQAHLRGGGELGRDWWHGGTAQNRQKCYDDLYAVAEDLIRSGITVPEKLAVTGGSAGGLMAGVALTQRPDLWAAVVPQMPFFDVIGFCRDPYGRQVAVIEHGDPDNPDDVRRFVTFSPYHLVRDGAHYPATFILAGDTDPRCPPWHARKFAARLQEANGSDEPILLRIWADTGHGWSTGRQDAVNQAAEWLAFVADRLGLEVE